MTWASAAVWTGLLASLQAGTSDFALRPERWETRSVVPSVENILRKPLSGPAAIDALGARVAGARGSAGLLAAGYESLGVIPAEPAPVPDVSAPAGLPPRLSRTVGLLIARLTAARADQRRAVASLSPADRVRARRAVEAAVGDDPFSDAGGKDFDAAGRFDLRRAAAAGLAAARAADDAVAELKREASATGRPFDLRWDTTIGRVIVSSGDAEFGPRELASAALIVRLGGRTRYHGPVAAAQEGQVRVVIDVGGPAVVESSGAAAGSADFGVGLLYLLGPGPHSVDAGPFSLGAARFGTAYAAVNGGSSRLASRRFGQGAAAYGVGALDTRGEGLTLALPLAGQGYGTTRGAGIWRHRGDSVAAECGFEVADAREALGSESLGQGAGMGPRAFAAGGIGVAHVTGDGARLNASYFAQGAGYWHGLGALFVRGDDARLQARRYSLGSGIHAAVGALDVAGKRAGIAAWGVGPGFGWDYGVGLFRLRGDDAKVRSDWQTGRADLGGRSLSWIEGDRAELSLPGFGSGSYTRDQAGYGLAVIRGRGARLRAAGMPLAIALRGPLDLLAPWGALHVEGALTLDPDLVLPDPVWPAPNRDARGAAESEKSARLLEAVPGESDRARLARQLFAASADILDPRPAEGAARALTALTEDEAPVLAGLLDGDRFDELIWARLGASGLGRAAARAGAAEAAGALGARRAALLDWLRFGRASEAIAPAEAALGDSDWRVRRQAALVLGSLFADDGGDEPGRRRLLRAAAAGTATPESVGRKRLSDLYAALALAGAASPAERVELLERSGSPFDSVAPEAIRAFAAMISSSPARVEALAREDEEAGSLVFRARDALHRAAADRDDEVASAALRELGGLEGPEDAKALVDAFSSPSAARREAGVAGLARLGPSARGPLSGVFDFGDVPRRALAARAAAQSWSPDVFALVGRGLKDADPFVRASTISGLGNAQNVLLKEKTELMPELRRMAESDASPAVRASAALAAAAISPAKTP